MAQPEGRCAGVSLPPSSLLLSSSAFFPGTLFSQVDCFLGPRTGACRRGLEGREGFLRWEGVGHGPRNCLYLKAMPDTSGSRDFCPGVEVGAAQGPHGEEGDGYTTVWSSCPARHCPQGSRAGSRKGLSLDTV